MHAIDDGRKKKEGGTGVWDNDDLYERAETMTEDS